MLIQFISPDFEFSDARGTLTQLVHDGWKQVNCIFSNAGTLRGGHYHKENAEAFYVIFGAFRLLVESLNGEQCEEYDMKAGDFFTIPPLVSHSFEFIHDTQLISLYSSGVENRDGSKDIHTSMKEGEGEWRKPFMRNHEVSVKKEKQGKKTGADSKIS